MIKILLNLIILIIINQINADIQIDNELYDLEYSIDNNENYEKLLSINLKTLKQNHNQFQSLQSQYPQQQSPNAPLNTQLQTYFTQIYAEQLSDKLRKQLLSVFEDSDGDLNTESIVKFRLCKSNQCNVSTFLYIWQFLNSNSLQMNVTIHLNQNLNLINSLIVKMHATKNGDYFDSSKNIYLTVNANLLQIRPAPLPDTYTYVEKVKKEIESKREQAESNNKSFFQKYWFYIVPFVVIVFISSFTNPEAGAAQ